MGCGTKPGSGLTMVDRIRLIEEQLQWRWAGWHWRCAGISDERHQTTSWTTGRSDEARPAGQAWQAGGGHQASYCQVPLLEQGCKPRRRIVRFQAEPGRETSSPGSPGVLGSSSTPAKSGASGTAHVDLDQHQSLTGWPCLARPADSSFLVIASRGDP